MTVLETAFLLIALITLSVPVSAKTGSTLYPPERVANARRNIERYDWAAKIRDHAVAAADKYADQSDDWLWDLVTPQSIPRGIHVNAEMGCPKCGHAIDKFGNYPYKCDVIDRPWKIECPSCGEIFPKNDFAKFYESGKDENGVFRYDKADQSLLFNTDHPDPKDPLHTYGVDDSLGWKDDKGNVYRFIGYYGHFGSWTAVSSALRSFRDAYLYTGDDVYARKAGILLYRIAQFYPDMDWSVCQKQGFFNSDGLTGRGKIYGCIWENGLAQAFISTYDAVYPGLTDSDLLSFLSQKVGKEVSAADVRSLIEKNIIHEVHDAILARRIEGNEGMYQNTMATAAVVLDEAGVSDKWLDWIFAPGDMRHGGPSGGNLLPLFDEKVDDDGMGSEASPGYNSIWRSCFRVISDTLVNYPKYTRHRITDIPKYRKMFETPVRLICVGNQVPNIGDFHSTGSPGIGVHLDDIVYAYSTFKDPLFAQMAYYVNGNKTDGIRGGIFDAEPEGVAKEVEDVIKEKGPYVPKTEDLPSYGLAILRSGSGKNQRALSLYYGRNTGHGHKDTLNIELFGLGGLSLMPDLGYPEYAQRWPSRYEWTNNTISHNTVVVDNKRQGDQVRGKSNFVVEGKGASAAEVYSDKVYPQTSLYQRTVAMVDVDEKDFYIVDLFRVKGGKEHLYSLHGPEGEVETEGLNLVTQSKGTLAGENISYGADLGGRDNYWREATGFQYLYDVRRDKHPSAYPAVTWKVVDTWRILKKPEDIRLRVDLLSPPGEVILAHGDPPHNKPGNPRRLTYLLSPDSGGESTFASIIEPYIGARSIKEITRTDDGDTVTIKVKLASGRTDYIVSRLRSGKMNAGGQNLTGRFAVTSGQNGRFETRLVVR